MKNMSPAEMALSLSNGDGFTYKLVQISFLVGRDLDARHAEGNASLNEGHGFSRAR